MTAAVVLAVAHFAIESEARAHAMVEPAEEGDARVLVLPVRVQGELPPDTAEQVRSIVADNLADEGVEVVVEGDGACEDASCRSQAAAAAGVAFVADAEVQGDEDEFKVTVTVYSADTGEPLAPFEDACQICGFVEVRDMARLRALDARAEIAWLQSEVTAVEPGPVEPTPVVVDRPAPRSKLVPAGWGLVGAGAAATLGGAVLLGLHKQSAGCLDNPRGGDCVPLRYTTAVPGGVLLGAGVAVLVGGVVMVVLGRKKDRQAQEQRVSVSPGGLRLRF